MLVLTFRPEFSPPWRGTAIDHVALQPLSADEMRALIAAVPGDDPHVERGEPRRPRRRQPVVLRGVDQGRQRGAATGRGNPADVAEPARRSPRPSGPAKRLAGRGGVRPTFRYPLLAALAADDERHADRSRSGPRPTSRCRDRLPARDATARELQPSSTRCYRRPPTTRCRARIGAGGMRSSRASFPTSSPRSPRPSPKSSPCTGPGGPVRGGVRVVAPRGSARARAFRLRRSDSRSSNRRCARCPGRLDRRSAAEERSSFASALTAAEAGRSPGSDAMRRHARRVEALCAGLGR